MNQRQSNHYSHQQQNQQTLKEVNIIDQTLMQEDTMMETDQKRRNSPQKSYSEQRKPTIAPLIISQTPMCRNSKCLDMKQMLIDETKSKSKTSQLQVPSLYSAQVKTPQPNKELPFMFFSNKQRRENELKRHADDSFKSPHVVNSPRILFPQQKNNSTVIQEPFVLKSQKRDTSLVKRSFNDYSSDKIEEPKVISRGTNGPNMFQRNLFQDKENTNISFASLVDDEHNKNNWQDNMNDDSMVTPAFKRQKIEDMEINPSKTGSPSIYQRWLKRDSVFVGKYSNGTTPLYEKPVAKQESALSLFSCGGQEILNRNTISPFKSKFFHIQQPVQGQFSHLKQEQSQNPFKTIVAQPISRSTSEINSESVPDTPMTESKYKSVTNDGSSQNNFLRNSNITSSEGNKQQSRFQEDYLELETLGKGQFGKVVRVQNKLDQLEYAVKLTQKKIRNCLEKANCLQEVYALSALSVSSDNSYIVRYYNGWIEEQNLYIVMELCKNSLRGYTQKKIKQKLQLTEERIKKIMRDVCLGLDELHSKGIVHLDIKPENILESFGGKFKLGDLGMARLHSKIVEEHDIPEGDCRYLAKELLNDDPNIPIPNLTKADIFALGITAYELIEGKQLEKNGQQWQDLRDGKVYFSEVSQQNFSQELLNTIVKMLHPNHKERPSPAQLLQTILMSSQEQELKFLKSENELLKQKLQKVEKFLNINGLPNVDQVTNQLLE